MRTTQAALLAGLALAGLAAFTLAPVWRARADEPGGMRFATSWEAGQAEARESGKPLLIVFR